MSPLEIEVGLHYHCVAEDHPRVVDGFYPVWREAADRFVATRLLEYQPDAQPQYRPTDGLRVWVEALCSVPLPVQRWVVPAPAEPMENEG